MKILLTLIAILTLAQINGQSVQISDINDNVPDYFPGATSIYPPAHKQSNEFTYNTTFPFDVNSFKETFPKGGVVYGNMDIDSDLELIYHTENKVYCINTDGSNVAGWPISIAVNETIEWVPSFGDITGNGVEEVVFTSTVGKIYAFNKTGNLINGFPLNAGANPFIATLGDLNNDYDYEIVVGINVSTNDGALVAYEGDGSLVTGFPVVLGEKIAGHVAMGDINGNGFTEIIIQSETNLWAFDNTGGIIAGFPFTLNGIDEIFSYSSPILVDLDNDLNHEIIFGSHESNNGNLYVLDNTGLLLNGWPQATENWIYASPVPVDLDNDGVQEIIVGDFNQSEDAKSSIYTFQLDGTLINSIGSFYGITSITATDIDNDGFKEFFIDANNQSGLEGKYFALDDDFQFIDGWPMEVTGNTVFSPLVIGDLNQTGKLNIMSLTSEFTSKTSFINLWESNLSYSANSTVNPFFQVNQMHNGYIETIQQTTDISYENDKNGFVKVFPNPSTGVLNVVSESTINHIEVTNLSGQKLLEWDTDSKKESIDISELPKGVYMLFTNTNEGNSFKKIVLN